MLMHSLGFRVVVICLVAVVLLAPVSKVIAECNVKEDKDYARKVYQVETQIAITMTEAAEEMPWWKVTVKACLLAAQTGTLIGSLYWKKLADDPPSPDYTEVFQPRVRNLAALYITLNITWEAWSSPELSAILNFTNDAIKAAEFEEAVTISLERLTSAVSLGNDMATRLQSQAVVEYGETLISCLSQLKTSTSTLDPLWKNFLALNNVTTTPSNITQFQQEVTQNGLPSIEQEALRALLMTDTDIANVTSELLTVDPLSAAQTTPINLTTAIGDMMPLYDLVQCVRSQFVGGIAVSVGNPSLLGPYTGLASTLAVATLATAICTKRIKRGKWH